MRVLHVLDRSVPDLSGYSIRSKYIIEFQKNLGIIPTVVTSPKYIRPLPYEECQGVAYYRFTKNMSGVLQVPFLREKTIMNAFEKKISRLIEPLKIDIIHAHSPSLNGLPAMNAARGAGIPFVYEMRAFWEDAAVDLKRFSENSLRYKISQYMEAKLLRGADALVGICKGIESEVLRRVKRDAVYIVENGVDTKKFTPQDRAVRLLNQYDLSGKIVVGFIGSFFTFEGLKILIEAAPLIMQKNPDVRFLIVGGGVEDENIRRLAKELGVLDTHVIFTGKVPHEEVMDYYSVMDILVYPRIGKRITELVTPLKPLEAMAMGKTVVVSSVGGLKELVDDGRTGIYFKAGDQGDLADKVLALAENEELRRQLGSTARRTVMETRNWQTIIPKYLKIYKTLLNK